MSYSLAYEANIVNRFFASNGITARVVRVRAGETVDLYILSLGIRQKTSEITRRTLDIEAILNRYRRANGISVPAAIRFDATHAVMEINAARPRVLEWRGLLPRTPFTPLVGEQITASGRRVVGIRLDMPDAPHVLISGTTGSGKTNLMNLMVATLAAATPPHLARFILIDLKGTAFGWAKDLPQVDTIVADPDAAGEIIARVASLMHKDKRPGLVLFIDEAARLAHTAEAARIQQSLAEIAAIGRERRVHLVVATQHPNAQALAYLVKTNIPVRVAGRVMDASASSVALGVKGASAHRLPGSGAFLMNYRGQLVRFQSWLFTRNDMARVVTGTQRRFIRGRSIIDIKNTGAQHGSQKPRLGSVDEIIRSYARPDGILAAGWLRAVTTAMNGGRPATGRVYERLRAQAFRRAIDMGLKPASRNRRRS